MICHAVSFSCVYYGTKRVVLPDVLCGLYPLCRDAHAISCRREALALRANQARHVVRMIFKPLATLMMIAPGRRSSPCPFADTIKDAKRR
jgi:hypothetical protein